MAVAYRSSGTIVASGDAGVDMSSSLPSGLAIDDIMIFVGFDADNEDFNSGLPSGWTVIHSNNSSSNFGFTTAWKRYDGTEVDWQFDTPSNAGQLVCGVIHAFSGCITTGTPFSEDTATGATSRTTHNTILHVGGSADGLVVGMILIEDNVAVTEGTHTGTWTERDNQTTTQGSDGRLMLGTTPYASASAEWVWTTTTSEWGVGIAIRLLPPASPPRDKLRSFITS